MDKVTEFLKENPHTLGLIFALFGVVMLIAAITGAKWLFKKDVSGVTYSLEKIDGRINMFGVKTARIVVGISAVSIIFVGMFWFLASIIISRNKLSTILQVKYMFDNEKLRAIIHRSGYRENVYNKGDTIKIFINPRNKDKPVIYG